MEGIELKRSTDGSLYYGTSIDSHMESQGSGVKKDKDGTWYIGEWSSGLREGFGAAFERDGLVKIGTWHEDQIDGDCIMVYPPESPYTAFAGKLAGDNFDEGAAFYADGRLYYGKFTDWQGAQFNGFGAFRRFNPLGRLICAGRWKNGGNDNGCIILRPNGRATGQLINAPEGYSAHVWDVSSERIFFYGITKDSEVRNAAGINFYSDDSAFIGTMRGGVKQGEGIYQNQDGSIKIGKLVGDVQEGRGISLRTGPGTVGLYIGEFSDDAFHGKGVDLTYANGEWQLQYCGDWDHGRYSGTGLYDLGDGSLFLGAFRDGAQDEPGEIIVEDGSRKAWKKTIDEGEQEKDIKVEDVSADEKSDQAVEATDAEEQYQLGRKYYYGYGVEKEYTMAYNWFKKASEQGNVSAQNMMGECHYYGRGVGQDYVKAVEWYQKAAGKNNAVAQKNLGYCYYAGLGLKQNYEKAVGWYKKAAEQGNAYARTLLGDCYYYGRGVATNYSEAVSWYQKAAEQGDASAQCMLGTCYNEGRGIEKDLDKAFKWFQKSAEQGYVKAQSWMGYCYEKGYGVTKYLTKAIDWYRKAAEKGNAFSQEHLGLIYYNGADGIQQDYTEAAKWYLQAAKQENAAAQKSMGDCYYFGRGVEQDYSQAVEWYRKAAAQGKAIAQYNLGLCYYSGKGVEKDYIIAFDWFRKSAKQGNSSGQAWLGCCYENGCGVDQDLGFAKYWYQKAASQGDTFAQRRLDEISKKEDGRKSESKQVHTFVTSESQPLKNKLLGDENGPEFAVLDFEKLDEDEAEDWDPAAQEWLGDQYYYGIGRDKNYEKAVELYFLAAQKSRVTAERKMGNCYLTGTGVKPDYMAAVRWYKKAAVKGDSEAQYMLANCYYHGDGVEKDYSEAIKWFIGAADQDNSGAQFYTGYMYEKGMGVQANIVKAIEWYRKAATGGNREASDRLLKIPETADEELEVRVGRRINETLSPAELDEFDSITDPTEVKEWLEKHVPNYRAIVEEVRNEADGIRNRDDETY